VGPAREAIVRRLDIGAKGRRERVDELGSEYANRGIVGEYAREKRRKEMEEGLGGEETQVAFDNRAQISRRELSRTLGGEQIAQSVAFRMADRPFEQVGRRGPGTRGERVK
jgi:hypothetical protein